jgi:adenylate cyclase
VLPFANMSGDAEQEYFADGITEDIITELSRFGSLFVIARNSSFTYKGKAVDVKRVGRELGVRYVLEGSVRKAGSRVRITGQLIDAQTGAHLWADRFDGALEDIFDLQDQVTGRVVSALMTNLERAEIERARRKPTASLDAYDYVLRAKALAYTLTPAAIIEALDLIRNAIAKDPGYGTAYALAGWFHHQRVSFGLTDPSAPATEAEGLARRAAQLAPDDPAVLGLTGYTVAYMARDLEAATGLVTRALAMGPNLALNWVYSAWILIWRGQPQPALDNAQKGLRLNPLDPANVFTRNALAHAHYFLDQFDAAAEISIDNLRSRSTGPPALRIGAAALAMAGRLDEAAALRERLQAVDPTLTASNLASRLGPYRRAEDVARYAEGLRRAGLPE